MSEELVLCQKGCGVKFFKHSVNKHEKFCEYFS